MKAGAGVDEDMGTWDEPGEYDGVVISAARVWRRREPGAKPTRYWDVRVEYDTEDGVREGQVYLPSTNYLAPGAEVIVRRGRTGSLRITPIPPPEDKTPGKSWKRPNVKAGMWTLIGIMAVTLVALIAVAFFVRTSLNNLQGEVNDKISNLPTQSPTPTTPASTTPSP